MAGLKYCDPLFLEKDISPPGYFYPCLCAGRRQSPWPMTQALATLALTLAAMTPPDRERAEFIVFTNAVATVESGLDYQAVGDRGAAVGAWQMHTVAWITANQWRKANGMPTLSRAQWKNQIVQRAMAISYLTWCKEEWVKVGKAKPSPQEIYIMFAWGYTNLKEAGFDIEKAPKAKRDAAERVNNIYADLIK